MSTFNQAKRDILEVLEQLVEATAVDLASHLGRSGASTAMAFLRYHRQGLISRYTIAQNANVYALTNRTTND